MTSIIWIIIFIQLFSAAHIVAALGLHTPLLKDCAFNTSIHFKDSSLTDSQKLFFSSYLSSVFSESISTHFLNNLKKWVKQITSIKLIQLTTANQGPVIEVNVCFDWKRFVHFFSAPLILNPLQFKIYFHDLPWIQCDVRLLNIPHAEHGKESKLRIQLRIDDSEQLKLAFEEASNVLWSENMNLTSITAYSFTLGDIFVGTWSLCEKNCMVFPMSTWYMLIQNSNPKDGSSLGFKDFINFAIKKVVRKKVRFSVPFEIPVTAKLGVFFSLQLKKNTPHFFVNTASIRKKKESEFIVMTLNSSNTQMMFTLPGLFKKKDRLTNIVFKINNIKINHFTKIAVAI